MNAILVFLLRLIFVLLSYLMIGWIAFSIFSDLRGKGLNQKVKSIPPLNLLTEIDLEQVEKRFTVPEVILGRDPACDFPINDETISLRHTKLAFHHRQWWVEDLASTNGTFLNETAVEQPVVITDGDHIRLGRKTLIIQINKATNGENHE